MSLHVRLQTSFWTHRKTLRLKVRIGEAALWVLPRIWSYAAENQPDGLFVNYSAEELAMLIGYSGDAQALLQALQDCGWFDGMAIHDWQEHNGYHHTFAIRAKKAADARWKGKERTGEDKKGKDKKGKEGSIATSNATSISAENGSTSFDEFWQAYPRRVGKGNAEAAWKKHGCSKLLPQILTAVRACKISPDWTKDGGQFIPHPATWLNRRGWEDELAIKISESPRKTFTLADAYGDDRPPERFR
jgi:hypothetical protein